MGDLFQLLENTKTAERKLQDAVQSNSVEHVRSLLSSGLDPNMPLNRFPHDRPLHFAALAGHLDVVQVLVQAGAKVDIQNDSAITPLFNAYRKGHGKVLKALLPLCRHGMMELSQRADFMNQYRNGGPLVKLFVIAEPCLKKSNPSAWNNAFSVSLSSSYLELTELLVLTAYKSVDSDFILKQDKVNERYLEVVRFSNTRPTDVQDFGDEQKFRSLVDWLSDVRKNPRSLSHSCRLAIRTSFLSSCNVYYGVQQLPLPQKLKDFLVFEADL